MENEKIALCLKALGDPKRLQLLDMIRSGTQCNCEFSRYLNLQPNLISHHLRILKEVGLVEIERDPMDSRWIYYTINKSLYEELRGYLNHFLDTERVQGRQPTCGPTNFMGALVENIGSNPK
ncbi:MAG TPA: metalloregulator ArsR/SmtB family transcription factor [Pelolinea sp.]|nr:metalloregulator ArsR/SmtB family transcription factor [Pelolinea sp.]